MKKMWKITKNKQNWWNWEKNIAKLHFFEDVIFGSQKIKKSNHQKCKNLIKRCQIFIAAYQRMVLNNIFGPPEPLRKFFFLTIKMLTRQNFHFSKKQWKIADFVILKFQKMQKCLFFHGFLQKMKILTSSPLDGQKKIFPGWFRWSKNCV